MAHLGPCNKAEFSTELEIHGPSRRCVAESPFPLWFSARSDIQQQERPPIETASSDGSLSAIDVPWLGRRRSFAARSSRSNEWRN